MNTFCDIYCKYCLLHIIELFANRALRLLLKILFVLNGKVFKMFISIVITKQKLINQRHPNVIKIFKSADKNNLYLNNEFVECKIFVGNLKCNFLIFLFIRKIFFEGTKHV